MIAAYVKLTKVISGQVLLAWLSSLAIFLGFAISEDKAIGEPIETSSGVVRSYSFARGSDFSFMLQSGDHDLELGFSNFRSRMDGRIENYIGQEMRVQYYGRLVANCWIGERQICFAKCDSDLQCRSSQGRTERKMFYYLAFANAMSLICVFFWAVYMRK